MSPKKQARKPAARNRPAAARSRPSGGRSRGRSAAAAATRRRRGAVVAAMLVGILVLGVATLVGTAGNDATDAPQQATTLPPTTLGPRAAPAGATITGDTPCPAPDGSAARTTSFAKAPPLCIDPAKTYVAEMKTSKGTMTIALDPQAAPQTVNSFVVLSRYHYFDGITFHRVIPEFVVQGGDPTGNGSGGPGYTVVGEFPEAGQYKTGSLAMAHPPNQPNGNGSQFFIIVGPRGEALPPEYSLFGQVTQGQDVVDAIEAVGTPEGGVSEPVTIESVTIRET